MLEVDLETALRILIEAALSHQKEHGMKKPEEMTARAFGRLVSECIAARNYDVLVGPQKTFARDAHVSPRVVGEMVRGDFPGKPKNKRPETQRKFLAGRIGSVTRVCINLGLDVEASLRACGLPVDKAHIQKARNSLLDLKLSKADLAMLTQQVDIIGPVPYKLIPTLVGQFRAKETDG